MSQFNYMFFQGPYGYLSLVNPAEYRHTGHVEVDYSRVSTLTTLKEHEAKVLVYFKASDLQIANVNHRKALETDLQELVALYLRNLTMGCPGVKMEQAKIHYEA